MISEEVKCRIILPNDFQVNGHLKIRNRDALEKMFIKTIEGYDKDKLIDEIIFEDMVIADVKASSKRKVIRKQNKEIS